VWFTHDSIHREHQWAQVMQQLPGAEMPLHGFGSSDCACASHLVRFARRPSFRRFQREIHSLFPEHGAIRPIITA
jgi:Uri superfamily endonuclease